MKEAPGRPGQAPNLTVMTVRRQGGAHVVTLPPAGLAVIGAETRIPLALAVQDGARLATPVTHRTRRYTLAELLDGAEHLPPLYADTAGARDGSAIG